MPVRVLVVDLEVVGVAASAADAIDLTAREQPDVVLVPDRAAADVITSASPDTRTVVLGASSNGDGESALTKREHEVLERMATGLGNRAIAEDLGLSLNTIRNYVQQVLTKLEAHSKLQAVAIAVERGLITRR